MYKRIGWMWAGAAIVALAIVGMVGCEDSGVVAPVDAILVVSASPSIVTLVPDEGVTEGETELIVAASNLEGKPLSGLSVVLVSGRGSLESGGKALKTNGAGVVRDRLFVGDLDVGTFKVEAQSGTLLEGIDVTVEVQTGNEPPRAAIIEVPMFEQEVGKNVLFDGSASLDPDGTITCYRWDIVSDLDPNFTEIIQGVAASALQKTYSEPQGLSLILRVSDRGDAGSLCDDSPGAPVVPDNLFSPIVAVLDYSITCANQPPVADAGADKAETIVSSSVSVTLDGSNSRDPDGTIETYNWDCGNGQAAIPIGPGQARCTYRAADVYTAVLTVFDNGTGVIDPNTQRFACEKSDTDEVTVTVTRPTS